MTDNFLTRLLLSLTLLFSGDLIANDSSLEYKIKAGYLYNFTKFITWPDLTSPTFNLCIVGADPFGTIIDPIEQKTAFNRSIKIIRLAENDYFSNTNPGFECHILYLGSSNETKGFLEKLQSHHLKPKGTLIVTDSESAIPNGEMIDFVNRDGKIKLRINLLSVKQSELKISAKLLEVAEIIKGDADE